MTSNVSHHPSRSRLAPFEAELLEAYAAGTSLRTMLETLKTKHGVDISLHALHSFLRRRNTQRRCPLFFERLPEERRGAVLREIAALWTHDSNALEGNTLSLGDTIKILEYGITIHGKSIREHEEVYGHARAVDLLYAALERTTFRKEDLFAFHTAIMPRCTIDWKNPIGGWKQESNGTLGERNGSVEYLEYASPLDVPFLMQRWLDDFNAALRCNFRPDEALLAYAKIHIGFVSIHPFFDGNGRLARLLSNLPVLKSGYPPVVISSERRSEYIDILWEYHRDVGTLKIGSPLVANHPSVHRFAVFLRPDWERVRKLMEKA